jgi:hypothetical protein
MKTASFFEATSLVMMLGYTYGAPTGPSTTLISQAEQQDALDFILNKTLASALETFGVETLDDNPSILEIRSAISAAPSQTHGDIGFQLNRMLLGLFQDAHYRVEVSGDELENYQYLDLCLDWIPKDDGFTSWTLVSTCDTSLVEKGKITILACFYIAQENMQATPVSH